jgi:hypothetical protein
MAILANSASPIPTEGRSLRRLPTPREILDLTSIEFATFNNMSKIVSIELDTNTRRALIKLQQMGLSQSDAIRQAIQDAALRLREPERLAAEIAKLEADPIDRAKMLAVINFKER